MVALDVLSVHYMDKIPQDWWDNVTAKDELSHYWKPDEYETNKIKLSFAPFNKYILLISFSNMIFVQIA